MTSLEYQKPFLKWVGGKTQILSKIIDKIPNEINNYHELFLGGGSVLLAVLSLQKQNKIKIKNKIYAYDINPDLINVYKNIQNNKDELYDKLYSYVSEYDKIVIEKGNKKPQTIEDAKTSKESYYYWLRNKYNNEQNTVERSALFMIINKTCFRGMHRVGPNGFNIPYGNYKTFKILSKDELYNISELIKNVIFRVSDFSSSIKEAQKGDFLYLDPPYVPENDKSFVGYNLDGFNEETHKNLFKEIKKLQDIKFTLSNSCVDLVLETFKDYNCEKIIARRAINSKNPGSKTKEVIIYN